MGPGTLFRMKGLEVKSKKERVVTGEGHESRVSDVSEEWCHKGPTVPDVTES